MLDEEFIETAEVCVNKGCEFSFQGILASLDFYLGAIRKLRNGWGRGLWILRHFKINLFQRG